MFLSKNVPAPFSPRVVAGFRAVSCNGISSAAGAMRCGGKMAFDDNNLASTLRGIVSRGHRDSTVVSALALAAALNCASTTAQAGNTYVVSTALDPTGPANSLSLREAITAANIADGNTIQFAPALAGSTITLTTGEIQISHAMNIVGPGAGKLAISGAYASRIFYLSCANASQHVSISGLSLRNGSTAAYGGAIASKRCYLDLSGANISASHAKGGGGVSFNNGRIVRTVVSGCEAQIGGGVLEYMGEGPQSIEYSTISSNHASDAGGGVAVFFTASSVINRSTINNNFVPSPGTSGGARWRRDRSLARRAETLLLDDHQQSLLQGGRRNLVRRPGRRQLCVGVSLDYYFELQLHDRR
jgi:hypothetical protein